MNKHKIKVGDIFINKYNAELIVLQVTDKTCLYQYKAGTKDKFRKAWNTVNEKIESKRFTVIRA